MPNLRKNRMVQRTVCKKFANAPINGWRKQDWSAHNLDLEVEDVLSAGNGSVQLKFPEPP